MGDDQLVNRLGFMQRRQKVWDRYGDVIDKNLADLKAEQRQIVRLRWLEEAKSLDVNWRLHRAVHYWFRVPMIIGAATVPVLAGLSASRYATAIVGLVVAVLAGVDSFFQLGTRWQQQRHAYCLLSLEGWFFIELAGPYEKQSTHSSAYKTFLSRLETLNSRLSETYLELFQREPTQKEGSQ